MIFLRLFIICCTVAIAAPLNAQPCEPVSVTEPYPELIFTIGFKANDSRFTYVECILQRALGNLGYKAQLIGAPAGRELYDAIEGRADGIAATTVRSKWPIAADNMIRLPDHFVRASNVVFTRVGTAAPSSWQELVESPLVKVYARHHRTAKAYLGKNRSLIVDNAEQAIQVFLSGRADILVTFEINREISDLPVLDNDSINAAHSLSESLLYTFINEKYQGLAPAMNLAIQAELAKQRWRVKE